MKQLLIVTCMLSVLSQSLAAQLSAPRPANKIIKKIQTSPGLESTPTRTETAPVVTNASYSLSTVKVDIRTGPDNKEALSNVSIELAVRDTKYSLFAQNNNTNEFRSNTTTSVRLEAFSRYTSGVVANAIPVIYNTSPAGSQAIMLSDAEKYGLALRIIYKPNFFADAWKIENVILTLEFRDAKGNLHPVSGTKVISFPNANTFLDNYDKRILLCTADGYFNPVTSFVTKDFGQRW